MKNYKVLLSLIFVLVFASACVTVPSFVRTIEGSGNVITESRDVSGFDRVTLSGFGMVTIEQGDEESLTVTTDDNIMPYIRTEVKNGTLILGFTSAGERRNFNPSNSIEFSLVVKDLSRIDVSGAGRIEVGELKTEKLVLDLSGAGTLDISSLTADELVVRQSGAGTLVISGQVKGQDVTQSGLGSYHASNLESETAIVDLSGAGSIVVRASDTLDVSISGLGNVVYYGRPRITTNISGLGRLISGGD